MDTFIIKAIGCLIIFIGLAILNGYAICHDKQEDVVAFFLALGIIGFLITVGVALGYVIITT